MHRSIFFFHPYIRDKIRVSQTDLDLFYKKGCVISNWSFFYFNLKKGPQDRGRTLIPGCFRRNTRQLTRDDHIGYMKKHLDTFRQTSRHKMHRSRGMRKEKKMEGRGQTSNVQFWHSNLHMRSYFLHYHTDLIKIYEIVHKPRGTKVY